MSLSRRDVMRLGGLGLAAGVLPLRGAALPMAGQASAAARGNGRRLGYAIIGLGEIAQHFGGGVKQSQHSKITGLVSGHRDKALQWAKRYGVPMDSVYSYEDMDRMKGNTAIDAVYVALPNAMHAEYTIRSAKAGKHVLCEKPMASTVRESEQMIAACRENNVKLLIAYRMQYEPLTLEAIQRVKSGEIGDVRAIESWNGFNIQPCRWRTDRKLAGGGPLMDVGIYSLNATRYLTGETPTEFRALQHTDRSDLRFKDIEETLSWTEVFPSGILASCVTTYAGQMDGYFKVSGTKGTLEMGPPAFAYEGITMKVTTKGAPEVKRNPAKDPAQFATEADALALNVFNDTPVKASGEEGLADMKCMSAIYQAAGLPGID